MIQCYSIQVTSEGREEPYVVYRRYREFDAIWRTLRKKFPQCNLMQLPKKHIMGNLKKDIVESRQVMLETFLEDILTKPAICQSSELFIFLQPSDNYAEAASIKGQSTSKIEAKQSAKKTSLFSGMKQVRTASSPGLKERPEPSQESTTDRKNEKDSLVNTKPVFQRKQPVAGANQMQMIPVLPRVPDNYKLRDTGRLPSTVERAPNSPTLPIRNQRPRVVARPAHPPPPAEKAASLGDLKLSDPNFPRKPSPVVTAVIRRDSKAIPARVPPRPARPPPTE